MHVPDFDIDWRLAKRFQEVMRLLVTYLEEVPSPRPDLAKKLWDAAEALYHPQVTAGASPEAEAAASDLANWVARIITAIERPWDLELDDL